MAEGPLSKFFSKKINEGEIFLFLIVNSVQYQCSLGQKTDNYRDLLFTANWMENCRKDFINRIKHYKADLYINSCTKGSINKKFLQENFNLENVETSEYSLACKETKGIITLQDIVETALEQDGFINENNYIKYNHPSYFVYQEARGNGNIFYPEPKLLSKGNILYFSKENKLI